MWVGAEEGAPAAPSRPPPGRRFGRVRCAIGPGVPVGGKMTSAAGWIIKAPAEPRTQSAPSRRRTAVGPLLAWQSCSASACPTAHRPSRLQTVCIPRSHRHHAPLPADRLRPAARATLAPALRSQARDTTEGGCCRGDAGLVRGVDRCGAQEGAESPERQTPPRTCSLKAGTSRVHSPASGEYRPMHISRTPNVPSRTSGTERARGSPEEQAPRLRGRWMPDSAVPHRWRHAHS